ncbi:MAG: peptidoglycan-binding domain-containing protein, partial [Candidatus Jorgensenbacteria bacterium]|nr:peptidoglycan-binding domain-containing protein [Candidatus Jorgensenbacteria bacterium]
MSKLTQKIAAVGLAATMLLTALPAFAATTADLQAQIAALLAQIQTLQSQLGAAGGTTVVSSTTFTRNLTVGSKGDDVKALQQWLNASGYAVATGGAAGSSGNETTYFGPATRAALAKYQAANGITPPAGYFGSITRAKVASAGGTTTGGTTTGGVTTPVVTVPSGTDLVVSLATDTPGARTIGSGTAFNPALKVALTAGSKTVKITSLLLQKNGFLANTNLNGVEAKTSDGVRHGNVVTSVNADNTVLLTFSTDPITVAAGSTEYITIRFNLLTGDYTGTIGFGITAATGVGADTTAISGSFPISGSVASIVNGGTSLASTTLDAQTGTGSSTLNVNADNLQEITKFRIQEVSSNEGVNLYKLTLYNYGSAADTDVKDVTLIAQDGTTLATAQQKNKWVNFELATPYLIDKGLTRDFTIKSRIIDGASRTINFVVYNNYDIDLRGVSTGVSVIPGNSTVDTAFPVGNGFNIQTIGSGTISLNRAADSPSNAVVPGATGVVLAKFTARPTGENYELRQVKFYLATSTNAAAVDLTGTLYIKVNGATVMSKAIGDISNTAATAYALSSYPILTAGQDATITVEGSVSSSATSVSTYQVTSFQVSQAKRIVTNDIVSNPTGTANGNSIAVKAAALVITTLSTPVANSVVAGTNSYELATIQLNAQSGGEDVKVSKLVVVHNGSSSVDTDVGTYYLYKDSDTSPLPTTATVNSGDATADGTDDPFTFTFSTPIVVARGTPVTLHLKANVLSGAATGSVNRFSVTTSTTAVTAVGVSTGNTLTHGSDITYAGNGQNQTLVAAGTLNLSLATGGPSANQIVNVGTNDGVYFAFKLTSQYETQKITSLKLTATSTGSSGLATTTLKNIRLYENSPSGTAVASAAQFDACDVSKCTVTFTATDNILTNPVPTTGVTIYVKADVAAGGAARLGDNFQFLIASSTGDVAVKGSVTASTGGTKTGTPTQGGVSYITPFRVVVEGISPTTAATVGTGAGVTVGVFKVTNNGGSAINLASTTTFGNFANGGSASTSLTFALYASADQGGAADASVTYIATSTAYGTSTSIPFDLTYVTAANRQIGAGSWRYLTIKTATTGSANNDTFKLGVNALGSLTYEVTETNLGYDADLSGGALAGNIVGLYVDGTPTLETVTAKT